MADLWQEPREVGRLPVLAAGSVARGSDGRWCTLDADGSPVQAVASFVDELAAAGCSASTARSYCYDLLR